MKYRVLSREEISRIGEVERQESVEAILAVTRTDSGISYSVSRVEKTPPIEIGSWGDRGIQARVNGWKPILEQGGFFYGALDKGCLVGFAILGPKQDDGSGVIEALFVHRDYRQAGISRRLMIRVEQEAKVHAIGSLVLHSNATESAVGFYMAIGFRITGENEIGRGMVEGIPGDIPMIKQLKIV